MHPVDTPRSLVAQLEDVRVLLPHPAMDGYRRVVVVADDWVLGEAAVQTPSGFGEGLPYLLWGHVGSPLSSPSLAQRKRNSLISPRTFPRRLVSSTASFSPGLQGVERTG